MLDKIQTILNVQHLPHMRTSDDTITTGFAIDLADGTEHSFPLFIQWIKDVYDDTYIRFNIVPFIDQPADGHPIELYLAATQANHNLPGIKLAFDSNDEIEFILDVPSSQISDTEILTVLQVLADYASTYYPQLLQLVADARNEPSAE